MSLRMDWPRGVVRCSCFWVQVLPTFGFPYKVTPSPSYWLSQAALWAGAGLLYGVAAWHFSERQFAKHARSAP